MSDNWVGYLTYNTGLEDAGLVVGFTRRSKKSSFRISTQVGAHYALLAARFLTAIAILHI